MAEVCPVEIPYVGRLFSDAFSVANEFRKRLGKYLREQRGQMSLNQFAKKLGISDSTLQRLEIGQQNITIDTLERIVQRTKGNVGAIFSE